MAINITNKTSEYIQTLIHDAFDINSSLDRIKTVLIADLVYPKLGDIIHKLAHNYSIDIADGLGDILEEYNESVKYGNIDKHIEEYANVQQAIDKAYELMLTYQNELNQVAKVSFENMDIHIYEKLLNIIELNNQYVAKIILIKDLADRYGDSPSFDIRIEQYM